MCSYLINLVSHWFLVQPSNLFSQLSKLLHLVQFSRLGLVHLKLHPKLLQLLQRLFNLSHLFLEYL